MVSNDPEAVEALFTRDAAPRAGVEEVVAAWVGGPQEVEYTYEPLAVEGDLGVAHWCVVSRRPRARERDEYDGILAITFAPDGRCVEHREWFSHRMRD